MVSRSFDSKRARTSSRQWSLLLFLTLLLLPLLVAAMDKNQIVQMSKLGLNDDAIIGAIDSSGEELKLSPEDLGELRLQGVSDTVITHLKNGGYVAGLSAPTDTLPAADGTGLEPAPAPAEGETDEEKEEREAAEAARQTEIEEKAQEILAEQRAEDQRQNRVIAVARKLPKAADMVQSGDNMPAARTYLEFLAIAEDPESPEWYEAKFGLAKALIQEGILSGGATPLLEVLLAGAEKPHFKEAFSMLEKVTREIGYRPPILEQLTKLYIGDLNQKFRNDFNYYMGKFFFDYNRADLAIDFFKKVPAGAKDHPEALYLMGVAQLDPKVNDVPNALRNFQAAILSAEDQPGGNEEILQMGYLALARTWYEVGYYNVALFYYQKIPRESGRNAEATFESAWAFFMKNDVKRALGIFHSLQSPYYDQWYFPDLWILEAAVYLNLCMFDQSKVAMAEFQEKYLDKQPRLQAFLTDTSEPSDYWDAMMKYDERSVSEQLPTLFANAVLNDLEFFNIYQIVKNLRDERDALQNNIASLGEFGQTVLDRVEEQLETKIDEGGILVQQKLSAIDRELTEWDLKAMKISVDIDGEEKRQLERRLRNPDWKPKKAPGGTTFLVVADDWQRWGFEGEFWVDEVPNYRSSLRTECVEQ
jgi:hypothetical protein